MSNVVIFVTADPRESGKANEALREGLGFAASQLAVRFVLAGEALRLLDEDTLDFVDGEVIEKNLGFYRKWKTPFHVLSGVAPSANGLALENASVEEIQRLLAGADRLVRF